ncbi:beta-N-acetylhexosaminidase [Mesocricetibacter intestinalis]|uniref:Beta-hexosaminidase n=1 Tax=Mesocricetibacter intestinalis TaxID=1521930 RepID=A0A4R6VBH5_9PAST|nr:beta-N-acetylhexosaminidase [Mesocricetibacter intestinalis]TDQ59557.1 beta-N-acetylhexosaminidase [Mesocricetibacter intestinalis]
MSTLLIDLQGQEVTQEEIELLQHPLVAGLILFSRNFYDREQIRALVDSVRRRSKKPLLITVDQEGGRVQRFRQGFTQLPAMQAYAALINDSDTRNALVKEAGWLMASEMLALDIDLSFAPVLDLGHQCKAIGDRSFHIDAEQVTPLAAAFIEGMHLAGMASTGKHFPGHGHVIADSHLETPVDDRPQSLLFERDIQPFRQLIAANLLDAVMPAHVIYTSCDPQPASGSAYWLQNVLRRQLGFKGAVFSDDLGMKGAGFMGDFVSRSEQALAAGCDLLLLCNEREGVIEVLDRLKLNEKQPHFEQRQQRLQHLFKRKARNWTELARSKRWAESSKKLEALQQDWLCARA